MSTQQTNRPVPGVMVGITHSRDLTPIIREPRVLKVGIGVPKGRASYVYTHQGKWIVRYGAWEKGDKPKLTMASMKFGTRQETEIWYNANKSTFAVSNRPQKIAFFTFTRRTIVEVNNKPEEIFEPDFAAIEAHGDTPRDIDIVFMGDNPLHGEFQAWSATELKCHGDGLNALRVIQLGNDKWPGWEEARAAAAKHFIVSECFDSGLCPYAQEGGKDKLVCKPMTTLSFQLANSIRLGATAYFTTTSYRSASQLFSSLEIIKAIAGRAGSSISNTPLKLVLAPFRTNHNGMAATQYGVSLELRSQDVEKLRALLQQSAWKPAAPRMIAEPASEEIEMPALSASIVTEEFYPDATEPEFEDVEPVEDTQSATAAVATNAKTEALAEKLTQAREAKIDAPGPPVGAGERAVLDSWKQRCEDTFMMQLGLAEYKAVLHSVTGSEELTSVTKANKDAVWAEMNKALAKVKAAESVPTGSLF